MIGTLRYAYAAPSVAALTGGTFSPLQVSGLLSWHDPAIGVTSSGGHVTLWTDRSGNGHTFAPPGSEVGPVDTAGVQNGLHMLKGDGSTTVLSRDAMAGSIGGTAQPYAFFAVVKGMTLDTNTQQIFIACTKPTQSGDPVTELLYDGGTGQWKVIDNANSGTANFVAGYTDAAVHLLAVIATATTITLYIDGVSVGSVARPGGLMTLDSLSVMAHRSGTSPTEHYQAFSGYYGDDVWIAGTLSAGDRASLTTFLMAKYAIPTPPAASNLTDTFVDADSTSLAAHTMDVGPGWSMLSGAWTVQSNKGAKTASNNGRYEAVVSDAVAADVTITCDLTFPVGNFAMGVTARAANDLNRWAIVVTGDGSLFIHEFHAGIVTTRASTSWTVVHSTTQTMTVTCSGTTISVSIGGASTSYGSATGCLNATRHGLSLYDGSGYGAGGRFDNFALTRP